MQAIQPLLPYFFQYGYLALFVILFLSAAYLPLPANIAVIAAGALSHFSSNGVHFNLFLAAAVAVTGNILGDVSGYYLARRFSSPKRRERFQRRHKSFRKIENYLKEHPFMTIGVSRLIGFASPIVNTLAGFTKLPIRIFLVGDIVGNALYTTLYIGIGYVIGSQINNSNVLIGSVTGIVVLIGAIYAAAIYLLRDT